MARITDPMTGESKEKGITSLTASADELAKTPLTSAASYSKRVREKQAAIASAKSRGVPIGHASPIPEGKLQPIADAARASRLPQPDFGVPPPPQIEEPPADWAPPSAPPQRPPIKGVGAAYAANQALSMGETDGPINMKESKQLADERARQHQASAGRPVPVSEETQQLLQQQHRHQTEDGPEAESEHQDTVPPQDRLDQAEKDIVERGQDALNYFDYERMARETPPLLKEERRKVIEARLSSMDFEDLITKREIEQVVPVIPGKFEITLRTVREREHMWVLEYIYRKTGVTSAAYIEEMTGVCKLVCGLKGINGRPIPDHRINLGQPNEEIDEKKFEEKLSIVLGFPIQLVADLGVQFNWFAMRVTDLFSVDNLKNG